MVKEMLIMEKTLENSQYIDEGMKVSALIQTTSVNYINKLMENDLITINSKGEILLTPKGKIANRIGVHHYLHLDENERNFLDQEITSLRVENRGLMLIFSGMFISLVLIIAFWALELQGF